MTDTPLTRLVAEDEATRRKRGTFHTPAEILGQPAVWKETAAALSKVASKARSFIKGAEYVVITGAGSSLHAARMMEAAARSVLKTRVQVVSCTDLMFAPDWYVPERGRGVVLSLSRSGNSPEGIEAARAVKAVSPGANHVVVSCNPKGALSQVVDAWENGMLVTLPEKAYDQAMATTASTTCTVLAGRYLLDLLESSNPGKWYDRAEQFALVGDAFLAEHAATAESIAATDPARVVVLGTLPLEAAAQEVAHKILELTDGQVASISRNFLEFRHGPIAFIDKQTTVLCLVSSTPLLAKYERDVALQIRKSGAAREVVVVGSESPELFAEAADRVVPFPPGKCNTGERAILATVFGQMAALFLSLRKGLTPDLPGSRGLVNPVVQGVTIYPRGG